MDCMIMNIILFTAVLSLLSLSWQQSLHEDSVKIIHVNKNGINRQQCLDRNSSQQYQLPVLNSCQTIEFVADHVGKDFEDIKIIVETDMKVSRPVSFLGGNKISICGRNMPRSTILSCKCSSSSTWGGARGFTFVNVQQIKIYNISFVNCCGSLNSIFNASLVIKESSNITIESVTIRDNELNSGIMLVNCNGVISIINSSFLKNNYTRNQCATFNSSFAAGIHMQFSGNKQAKVSVKNCHFEDNCSPEYRILDPDATKGHVNLNGYGLGGGMGVVFMQQSSGAVIDLHNTTFRRNWGNHGGGLCIHFQGEPSSNNVTVRNSMFLDNKANVGGGGLKLSFGLNPSVLTRNYVYFQNLNFERNLAKFGGGLSLSSLLSNSKSVPGDRIRFTNCMWRGNFGVYGPAIELSPFRFQHSRQLGGFLPIPLFINCNISDHFIRSGIHKKPKQIFPVTQGVFVIVRFTVNFDGKHIFRNNTYSAVYLTAGRAVFKPYSEVLFSDNVGLRGGAISANGFSTIVINDNSEFHFVNNSAVSIGGAIYYAASDQREYFEGRSCFLEYGGNERNLTKRNISLNFTSNSARRGSAIFSASLFSCYFSYIGHFNDNIIELLESIGDFQFDVPIVKALATGIRMVKLVEHTIFSVIPGKSLHLPLGMMDEFKSYINSGYSVRVKESNPSRVQDVHLSNYFTINNSTRVFGPPNSTTKLILSTPQEIYNIQCSINVTLLSCPPGFFYDEICNECKCSADVQEHSYPSIPKCDHSSFRAFVYYGFWVGFYPAAGRGDHSDSLYTALFPFPPNNFGNFLLLPNNSENLTEFMCNNNRIGVLCGKCRTGFSTYYHSKQFICGDNRYCKFGILFYFLTDILSLTLFFTVVITFGVSLSSGGLNGLVFFSQVVDLFSLDDLMINTSSSHNKTIHNSYQLVYGIFNLDFFSIFPFCLWKGATIMDILLFKYVTIIFAFILILLIILVANYSNRRIKRLCGRLKVWTKKSVATPKSSMIHGISTLLIISYGQCTKATFSILTKVYLRSKPGITPIPITYYGGIPFLEGKHLIYAISAIVVCLTFVILPPLFLLFYPSLLHILSLCNLSEHRAVHRLLACMGINRLMPLLDSLQGCYRDKLRFFSGLYFLYRVAILLAFTFSELTFYVVTQFLLLLMLGIHSVVQPYRLRKHNIFDGLIFLNLAIINGIMILIKLSLTSETIYIIKNNMISVITVQIAFAYLPIIAVILFGSKQVVAKMVSKCTKIRSANNGRCDQQEHKRIVCSDISHTSIALTEPFL